MSAGACAHGRAGGRRREGWTARWGRTGGSGALTHAACVCAVGERMSRRPPGRAAKGFWPQRGSEIVRWGLPHLVWRGECNAQESS